MYCLKLGLIHLISYNALVLSAGQYILTNTLTSGGDNHHNQNEGHFFYKNSCALQLISTPDQFLALT